MKKILLFCLGMIALGFSANAQATTDDLEHAQEASKGEKMKALLGLSDEQLVKYREIVLERRAAIKAVKTDASLSPEAQEAKLKPINEAREAKLKTLLTPEQFAKWLENQKKKD